MGRAHPGPDGRRWRRASASRPSRPTTRARTSSSARGQARSATRGTIPRDQPGGPGRRRPGPAPPRTAWPDGAAATRPGRRPTPTGWDGQTFATWLRAQRRAPAAGATLLELGVRGGVGRRARGRRRCCTCSSTSTPAGSFESSIGTAGGAQQDRFVGRISARRRCGLAERAGRPERILLGAPVARDRARRPAAWRFAPTAPRCARRRAIVAHRRRRWPGASPTTRRCPAYRDQLTQRMPQGTVIKCMAIYDEPFWRADGLSGAGHERHAGPVRVTFDNSPPDGSPGVLLGFLEGRHARRAGRRGAAGGAPGGGRGTASPALFGAAGARRPPATSSTSGPTTSGRAGCYGCYMPHGRLDGSFGPRAAGADRPAALGRAPRPPRSGAATWTGPSSPGPGPGPSAGLVRGALSLESRGVSRPPGPGFAAV